MLGGRDLEEALQVDDGLVVLGALLALPGPLEGLLDLVEGLVEALALAAGFTSAEVVRQMPAPSPQIFIPSERSIGDATRVAEENGTPTS
jgi:hypothetical protein